MPRSFVLVAVALAMAGCTTGYEVDAVRQAAPEGDAFTSALTSEYRELAVYEADEMADWRDASHYARKGLGAASGMAIRPDSVDSRWLPAGMADTLTGARTRLVDLLDRSGRSKAPGRAAQAQSRFDCWLEQQEENHQPGHIARCREEFYAALDDLEAAMQPEPVAEAPEPEPEPMEPKDFIVYFDFDSAKLTDSARSVLDNAAKQADKMAETHVVVTAHTDTAGPESYNDRLSMRRAVAVKDYLMARGLSAERIGVNAHGENRPAVMTGDNVRQGANRRVEITLL